MRREEAKSLLDQVLSAARGEEIEVILGGGTEALTRFANNEITQNVAERRYLLSVRVVQGKRTGRATGNDLSRAGRESHRARDVSGDALSARAVEKALRSREPKSWEPGRYAVVLEPAAVADLIQDMSWISFGALLVQEGRSFLSGKIGKKVMGENITLKDEPFHPLHRGSRFDSEGMPTLPTTIIEKGVAKSAVYDRQTAAKEAR